jgi:hypothetical protein
MRIYLGKSKNLYFGITFYQNGYWWYKKAKFVFGIGCSQWFIGIMTNEKSINFRGVGKND